MTAKKKDKEKALVEEKAGKRFVVEEVSSVSPEEVVENKKEEEVGEKKALPEESTDTPKEEVLEVENNLSEEPEVEKEEKTSDRVSIKQVLMIAVPTALMVAALTGGIIYYMTNVKTLEAPQATIAPTFSPIPTPEATTPGLEKDILKVQVLNGSGVKGVAGVVKDYLEGLGYKDVDTGNASSYDYDETVLQLKDDRKAYEDMLVEDLSKEYDLAKEVETLDEGSDFDAVIIAGKN